VILFCTNGGYADLIVIVAGGLCACLILFTVAEEMTDLCST